MWKLRQKKLLHMGNLGSWLYGNIKNEIKASYFCFTEQCVHFVCFNQYSLPIFCQILVNKLNKL